MNIRKLFAIVLTVLLIISINGIQPTIAENLYDNVIINQVYGCGTSMDAAISHSFIELYNPTDSAANMTSYSVQYTRNGSNWDKLDLTGVSIPAKTSYLIRCAASGDPPSRFSINIFDKSWDRSISNNSFKIALVNHKTLLTKYDPAPSDGVVDFVAAYNTDSSVDYAWGTPLTDISKQKAARRIDFSNTGDNNVDFESIDYRVTGINDTEFLLYKPRSVADGKWGEDIVPPARKLIFSHEAGMYKDAFNLTLTTDYKNAVIKYTIDGNDPKITSTTYSNNIRIENRTSSPNVLANYTNIYDPSRTGRYYPPSKNIFKGIVIKTQVFSTDGSPLTTVYTRSYFINASYGELPVISLVTDKNNFFDANTGIYVFPNMYNSGSDWERPVHFELFEQNGTSVSLNMGMRIHGAWTRAYPQKSLRLYAKKGYDGRNPTVEYDLFKGNAKTGSGDILESFKRFILRNSGNDWDYNCTMIRDAMIQDLMRDTNVMHQAYRQSVVFVNGEFWGIHNIRERIDDENLMRKYNFENTDDVGILSFPGSSTSIDYTLDPLIISDYESYLKLYNWFNTTTSLVSKENYDKAQTFIDIDNFIDYYIINSYTYNEDWPGNNNVCWRYRTEDYPQTATAKYNWKDGRWRWLLKDMDFGFNLYGTNHAKDPFARLLTVNNTDWDNAPWSTLLFRRFYTNKTFRDKFVNRYCDLLNTNLKSSSVVAKIDRMQANIEPAIQQQYERWNNFAGVPVWKQNIQTLRSFANNRPYYMYNFLQTQFGMQPTVLLNLSTDDSKGHFVLNDMPITAKTDGVTSPSAWSGTYYTGLTQNIKAVPLRGYKFEKFIVSGQGEFYTDTIEISLTENTTVEAHFTIRETVKISVFAGTGGEINGGGTYFTEDIATVYAIPDDGYAFDGWYENGILIENANTAYSFTASVDRTLEARFVIIPTATSTTTITITTISTTTITTTIPTTTITTTFAFQKGDINGDNKINGMDLLLMKQHILDIPNKTIDKDTPSYWAANMNDDEKINGMDLLLLKKKILS